MPFCPNCGSQVEGRFCARCGVSVDAGSAPPPSQPGAAPPPAATSGLSENVAAALCYLLGLITGILFLALAPYNQNRNVRFHAFQSIFFNVAVIVISIVLSMISVVAYRIFGLLGILFSFVHLFYGLAVLCLWLFLMWKAYNNQRLVLPIVGPLAEKQA